MGDSQTPSESNPSKSLRFRPFAMRVPQRRGYIRHKTSWRTRKHRRLYTTHTQHKKQTKEHPVLGPFVLPLLSAHLGLVFWSINDMYFDLNKTMAIAKDRGVEAVTENDETRQTAEEWGAGKLEKVTCFRQTHPPGALEDYRELNIRNVNE